jgi:hypothetical protein
MTMARASLDQARLDLLAIEAELSALAAAKSAASRSAASFTQWRTDNDAKAAERERLTALIETLEQEVVVVESEEAVAALRKRYAAKVASNAKLATRIRADLAKTNSIVLALIRDVAQAAAEDVEIGATLPDDLEPLVPADFLARGRPAVEAVEIGRERVWLWTNTRGGALVGDQDAVLDRGNGRGQIGEGPYTISCIRALFEQIEYHPAEQGERPQAFWQMRLPQPDGPGFAFDGSSLTHPHHVLGALEKAERPQDFRERPVEISLRPVPSVAADEEAPDAVAALAASAA